ncbi:NAD(P)-dependent oxidoreductase [Plantactinospora sp. KLBMP9567]|uniref:NAD(P)-dependent oxidoreductase n=1 Tax=Plantactinospora sp. KLBMP9567 TaxID=3085900 RepID=UPI002981B2A0|nr:NAD(P)-dependent oxidoreductase [Plantactinospora sp. KLBMP9567]MDW5329545.1 NAD(P)-dependent oxidoreductase [Plantactinospora sp. KLBMP9567]
MGGVPLMEHSYRLTGAIMAHPKRIEQAARLADRLPPEFREVVTDPDPTGAPAELRTSMAAWSSVPADSTHHLVMHDDMTVSSSLVERARRAVEAHPHAALALFAFWSSRNGAAVRQGALAGARWVRAINEWTPTNALILPRDVAQGFVRYARGREAWPSDVLMHRYLRAEGIPAYVAVPNLVEHDDLPSLVNNTNQGLRRSACFFADDPAPQRGEEGLLSPSAVPFFVYYSRGVAHCAVRIPGGARPRWTYSECADYLHRFGVDAAGLRSRMGPAPAGVDEEMAWAVWLTAYTMGALNRLEGHGVVPGLESGADPVLERALGTLVPGGVCHRVDARYATDLSARLLPTIRHGLQTGLRADRRARTPSRTGRRVLVSGGNTFVGEYLAHRLADLGHEVLSLDAEKPAGVHEEVTYLVHDGSSEQGLAALLRGVDAVVHAGPCAWADNVREDLAGIRHEHPVGIRHGDLTGIRHEHRRTGRLLGAAASAGVGTVVFLSSYRVYAGGTGTVDESAASPPSTDPVAGEIRRIEELCARHGAVVLRLGTPYGPGMPRHNALAEMVLRSIVSRPIVVEPDERWPVQLVHLRDVAGAVHAVLTAPPSSRLFNIGNVEALSHQDLREEVFRVVRPIPVEHAERLRSCVENPVATVDLAAEELGWRPSVDVGYALHGYAQWLAHDLDD